MERLKRLIRTRPVQETVGFLLASYLGLVRRTNRFVVDPPDAYDRFAELAPVILAMWHGQHFMVPFVRRAQDRAACLVSRSPDGEMNAIVLRHAGVRAIRGSGARGRDFFKKGGHLAMREMIRALEGGESIAMTADVPKIARRCGQGIVMLAKLSGRPIVPVAVVTSRRVQFDTWDKSFVGLPFGRGAILFGEPVFVAPDADPAALEAARRVVEDELDGVHARAYARFGASDPGAERKRGEREPARTAVENGSAA